MLWKFRMGMHQFDQGPYIASRGLRVFKRCKSFPIGFKPSVQDFVRFIVCGENLVEG